MSLLIKNGEIITADSRYKADIFCEGETISVIGKDLAPPLGSEVIDATGKFIFPGFIDPHVHIYLPFMGTYSKDTYETGSQAAFDRIRCPQSRDPRRGLRDGHLRRHDHAG